MKVAGGSLFVQSVQRNQGAQVSMKSIACLFRSYLSFFLLLLLLPTPYLSLSLSNSFSFSPPSHYHCNHHHHHPPCPWAVLLPFHLFLLLMIIILFSLTIYSQHLVLSGNLQLLTPFIPGRNLFHNNILNFPVTLVVSLLRLHGPELWWSHCFLWT